MRLVSRAKDRDAGAVAVITAICAVLLFGVAALTVDIGRTWEVRRQSQSEVDLAALAGALHLPKNPVTACQTALQYLKDNTPTGQDPGDVDDPSSCAAAGTTDKQIVINGKHTRITVTTHPKIVNFGLAGAIGFRNAATGATATAEIRSPGGIDPFSVAVATEYGLQCIHDTGGNGGGPGPDAMRAALTTVLPMVPPTFTSLSQHVVPIGEQPTITVKGSNLGGVTQVKLGNVATVPAVNVANSGKSLDFVPPVESVPTGPVDVQLIDPANGTTPPNPPADQLSWAYVQPTVTSVTPATGWGGDTITIAGTHFGGTIVVTFGANAATNVQPNATADSMTVKAPAGVDGTLVHVKVSNAAGASTTNKQGTNDDFTYRKPPGPTVTGVAPNKGAESGGTAVIVSGTNFGANPTVKFGNTAATITGPTTSTTIPVVSPPGTGTVDVTVTTSAGDTSPTSNADKFTYGKAPTVTSINPNGGPSSGGTTVDISGTGFSATSAVFFGGILATNFQFISPTEVKADSPAGNGTVDVQVQNDFALSAATSSDQFTYANLADSCGSSTGDFGYLNVHSNDVNANGNAANTTLQLNIIKGLDHVPDFWPTVDDVANSDEVNKLDLDTECLQGNTRLDGAWTKLDADPPAYTDGFNCLDIEQGNKVADAGAAFLDGITYKNAAGNTVQLPARLANPDPSTNSRGTVLGRPNLDTDSIARYLNGIDMATFLADIGNAAQGNPTNAQLLNDDIVNCPRFMLLPVLHTNVDPPSGQYPLQDYVGAFVENFVPKSGGNSPTPQVSSILAYVFPLSWIGAAAPDSNGTVPFVGAGPVVPILVK